MYYILLIIIIISILFYKFKVGNEPFTNFYTLKNPGISLKLKRNKKYKLLTGEQDTPLDNLAKFLILTGEIELEKVNSNSLDANLDSIIQGNSDFAIVSEKSLYQRIMDHPEDSKKINFVAAFFEQLYFLITKADNTNLNSFGDFKNGITHRGRNYIIGTGEKNSNHYKALDQLCNFLNINLVEISEGDTRPAETDNTIFYYCGTINTIYNLFLRNVIDGIFILSGPRLSFNMNLSNELAVKIIPFPKREFSLFKQIGGLGLLEKEIIIKENIITTENTDRIDTFGIRNMLVCRKSIQRDDVYTFTKNIYSNLEQIKNSLKMQNNLDTTRNVANLDNFFYNLTSLGNTYEKTLIPLRMVYCDKIIDIHPGSKDYYIEKNLINIEGQTDCNVKDNELCQYLPSESKKNIYWKYERIGGLQGQFER